MKNISVHINIAYIGGGGGGGGEALTKFGGYAPVVSSAPVTCLCVRFGD